MQSLPLSRQLNEINPYDYVVNVLQRVVNIQHHAGLAVFGLTIANLGKVLRKYRSFERPTIVNRKEEADFLHESYLVFFGRVSQEWSYLTSS